MAAHRHKNRAFTLIELLVVISIVAILMAILMPSLSRARKQAQFVRCKSNLKSYGVMALTSMKRHSELFFFGEENLWITTPYNSYAFNDTAMCVYEVWDSFGTFHLARHADLEDGVVNAVFLDGQVQTVHRVDSWRYCAPDGQSKTPLKEGQR